jgi:hypothetical protein
MAHDLETIEGIRADFRPSQITTLFVGESAPVSGDFFYLGNTALKRHMQRATDDAFGSSDVEFLDRFKAYGWFLDDLVLTPVNHLTKMERIEKCAGALSSLATRIAEYQPLAIVSLLKSIQPIVEAAAISAGSIAPRYAVPFPGMGQQGRFMTSMAEIMPKLPRRPAERTENGQKRPSISVQ